MIEFGDAWRGRRVLITGHTGFKGSWLALWLHTLGAHVTGVALAPDTEPNHWALLGLDIPDHRIDVRDVSAIASLVDAVHPEIVFHLAAQSLVRPSYRAPPATWSTNVMGTVNVLEACRHAPTVRGIVVVTTDKVYENRGDGTRYTEGNRLGGHDPYSASKAAAELAVASYRTSFFDGAGPIVATARAGNVIGGGDWSFDRLIPDLYRAASAGSSLEVRSPDATRPWQHVLESLAGYLALGRKLLEGDRAFGDAWNFGPRDEDDSSVNGVLVRMREFWPGLSWQVTTTRHPHEAARLHLDSSKAASRLGWNPVWNLDTALEATAVWYRSFLDTTRTSSAAQLAQYVADARSSGASWAQ